MRDAGVRLYEVTDAALDWFLRCSDKGHYGIYLEARGIDVVVNKSYSESEEDKVAKAATQSRPAAHVPAGVVQAENRSDGVAKTQKSSQVPAHGENHPKRKRGGEADAPPEAGSRPSKQQRVSPPTPPAPVQVPHTWLPSQTIAELLRKPPVIRTGDARCRRCIDRGLAKCLPREGRLCKACQECYRLKSTCSLVPWSERRRPRGAGNRESDLKGAVRGASLCGSQDMAGCAR